MEPAVKPAVEATVSGVVGVLATIGTLESARFAALLEKYAGHVKIITQGCPGLVELVERGDLHSLEARHLIERYTLPLLSRGADTLILGCTHYPFLAPLIREVTGENITLVDTGAAVARELKRRIESELPNRVSGDAAAQFFTSGDVEHATRIMSLLWGESVEVRRLPE
jgi:glutamate racemase